MRLAFLPLIPLAFLLSSCGGGGSTGPITVTLRGSPAQEGYVIKGSPPIAAIYIGDVVNGTERGLRAFVSFDLDIPAGARVTTATLRLKQFQVVGTPHASLGVFLVDQVVYGAVLDAGAYDRSFPVNQGLPLEPSNAALDAKTADVKAILQNCVDAQSDRAQFRLRFAIETNANNQSDFVQFDHAGDANEPILVVTYQP